jgi:glucose uptake protein GlcU
MKTLQFIELILTSFLFALIIANLVEILKPELWLVSALISFIIWSLGGFRFFKLKNERLNSRHNY